MIIGISGKAQHGKDTFARFLGEAVDDSSFVKYKSFAYNVKKTAATMFNLDNCDWDNKDKFIDWAGITIREAYQLIGTEVGRKLFGEDFWIKRLERDLSVTTMSDRHVILISDVRFQNECDWINKQCGINIRIKRPDVKIKESNHASEKGLDSVEDCWFDYVIENNGTLEELNNKAKEVWEDMEGKL